MNSLKRLLGPAPSEMPVDDLIAFVSAERERVRRSLLWFKTSGVQRKPTKAKAKKRKGPKLSTLAKKAGLSPEQLAAAIAKMKEEKA